MASERSILKRSLSSMLNLEYLPFFVASYGFLIDVRPCPDFFGILAKHHSGEMTDSFFETQSMRFWPSGLIGIFPMGLIEAIVYIENYGKRDCNYENITYFGIMVMGDGWKRGDAFIA